MPLGPWELGIILLIVIVIFGAGKLPEIGGAVGKSIREFKTATKDMNEDEAKDKSATPGSSDLHKEEPVQSASVAKDESVRS